MISALLLAIALPSTKPPMRDFIGLNTHTVQFKTDLYAPVTRQLRNYHPVAWDLGDGLTQAAAFPNTTNGVNWMDLYGSWKKAGYTTDASAQFESIKRDKWTDVPKQAFAYGQAFAKYMGANKLVNSVEIGNEPAEWSEADYRIMFENMAKGIRAGDPTMKILPCAVAVGKEDKYSKDVTSLEGLEKYIDILNVHTYAFAEMWPTWRRSYPEDPKINYLKQIDQIIAWKDKHAAGKPVWVTEFGWDASTKPNKPDGDFAKFMGNTDAEQARYIVRSYLVMSGMDVEKAYLYWFDDNDEPTLHAASGLTRHFQPKPSFHAVAHLLKALGDYTFDKVLMAKEGDVYAYRYRSTNGGKPIIAVWSPTGSGRSVDMTLPASLGKPIKAERMPMASGAAPSVPFTSSAEGTRMTVSEDPVYLTVQE